MTRRSQAATAVVLATLLGVGALIPLFTRSDRGPPACQGEGNFVDVPQANWRACVHRHGLDLDGDGDVDEGVSRFYDPEGYFVREEYDLALDGTVDFSATNTYADGRLVRQELDRTGDGIPDRVRLFEYDADGAETAVRSDVDGDGVFDECRGRGCGRALP